MLNFAMSGPVRQPYAFEPCGLNCAVRTEDEHRIANHLTLLSALVQLKGREFAGEGAEPSRDDVQLLVQSLDGQIRSVARLHRLLMAGQPDAPVDLASLLHEVCAPFASGAERRIAIIEHLSPGCS